MTLRRVLFMAMAVAAMTADAAGQRTHIEMGRRALERYCTDVDKMLPGFSQAFEGADVRSAFYAGCMFPDWAYPSANNQASEDAHWKRYHEPYFEYLREKCPYPWNEEEKKRVAFFLGIVCHGMTDLPWHFSKEGHDSLLAATWGHDRAGHTETEYSYDLFLYQGGTPQSQLVPKLWWPMDDIRAVYRAMGTILPAGQLENGFNRTHAMINAGPVAASLSADSLKRKFPWTKENVEGYYFGGVEHGAALTASWLKYYFARFLGIRFYQQIPTAVAEDNDERIYKGCIDATVSQARPDNNTGGEPFLEMGGDKGNERAALIRFDATDIDKKTAISKAELWLCFHSWEKDAPSSPARIGVYPAKRAWEEGHGATNDVHGFEGQAHRDGSVTWSTMPTVREQEKRLIDRASFRAATSPGQWVRWDITDLARQWIAKPDENFGAILRQESGRGVVRFYSSEAFRTDERGLGGGFRVALRPILIVFPAKE